MSGISYNTGTTAYVDGQDNLSVQFTVPGGPPVGALTSSFEGGTSGTPVTTANSGGGSGTAFDAIDTPYGGSVVYSSAQAAHGSLSGLCNCNISGNATVVWSTSLTSSGLSQAWFREYVYLEALPPSGGTTWIMAAETGTSGPASAMRILVNSSGQLQILNAAGSLVSTSTVTVSAGAWFRIEGYVTGSDTAGQVQLKIFLTKDAGSPDETDTTNTTNTGGTITALDYGLVNSSGNGNNPSFYIDDLGASATGYLGPAVPAVKTGDVMLLNVQIVNQQAGPPDLSFSGGGGDWTLVPITDGSTNPQVQSAVGYYMFSYAYQRVATEADIGATVTITDSTAGDGDDWTVALAAYTRANQLNPVDRAGGSGTIIYAGPGSLTLPSETARVAGDWAVYLAGAAAGATMAVTGPSGTTQRQNYQSADYNLVAIYDSNGQTGLTSVNGTFATTNSDIFLTGFTICVAPAPPPSNSGLLMASFL